MPCKVGNINIISIHAPRAGSDDKRFFDRCTEFKFQSTLPVRGATLPFCEWCKCLRISIHAPRAGSDLTRRGTQGS